MDYMTLKETAEKWGVIPHRVNYYCSGGFLKFCLTELYAKSDYFLLINFIILLRFTANIVIAPCISMPIRPDDEATP